MNRKQQFKLRVDQRKYKYKHVLWLASTSSKC